MMETNNLRELNAILRAGQRMLAGELALIYQKYSMSGKVKLMEDVLAWTNCRPEINSNELPATDKR